MSSPSKLQPRLMEVSVRFKVVIIERLDLSIKERQIPVSIRIISYRNKEYIIGIAYTRNYLHPVFFHQHIYMRIYSL